MLSALLSLLPFFALDASTEIPFLKCTSSEGDSLYMSYATLSEGTLITAAFGDHSKLQSFVRSAGTGEIISIYVNHEFYMNSTSQDGLKLVTLTRTIGAPTSTAFIVFVENGVENRMNFDNCRSQALLSLKAALGEKAKHLAISSDSLESR